MSKRVKTLVMSEVTKRFGDTRDFLVLDASKVTAVKVNKLRLRAENAGLGVFGLIIAPWALRLAASAAGSLSPARKIPGRINWLPGRTSRSAAGPLCSTGAHSADPRTLSRRRYDPCSTQRTLQHLSGQNTTKATRSHFSPISFRCSLSRPLASGGDPSFSVR